MNLGFSTYLDLVRFLAALAVVLSHLAYPRFTDGTLQGVRDWNIGSDAVILFFVLSGLVIAYATERDDDGIRYTFNRLTRLWSVLIPALILTFLLDRTGSAINPQKYLGWWYVENTLGETLVRGLTFTNQWFLDPVRLGTNGPLWSLSYEAAYYLLMGIAVFLKGVVRIAALLISVALIGLNPLILMPVWLFGVALWRIVRQPRVRISMLAAVLFAVLFPVFYLCSQMLQLPSVLRQLTNGAMQAMQIDHALGFSHPFLWSTLLGAFFAMHLCGMARLLKGRWSSGLTRGIRWLAGASFTIYVLHYPLLQFVDAILPSGFTGRSSALLALVLLACFLVAEVTERRLNRIRSAISAR